MSDFPFFTYADWREQAWKKPFGGCNLCGRAKNESTQFVYRRIAINLIALMLFPFYARVPLNQAVIFLCVLFIVFLGKTSKSMQWTANEECHGNVCSHICCDDLSSTFLVKNRNTVEWIFRFRVNIEFASLCFGHSKLFDVVADGKRWCGKV